MTMIQTRASGTSAQYDTRLNKWLETPVDGLSSINTANVAGALYYIIAETIDRKTGYNPDTCERKNQVKYIQFYTVTYCNPDAALWWFNQREAGVKGDPEGYSFGEFGHYLAFDEGTCRSSGRNARFCNYLGGTDNQPNLGPFVGWQGLCL